MLSIAKWQSKYTIWLIGIVLFILNFIIIDLCIAIYDHGHYESQNDKSYQEYSALLFGGRLVRLLGDIWHFIETYHEPLLALFTIALAVFTLGLWIVTANIGEDAKDAAKRTLDATEDTSKRELRAYVGVTYPEIKIDGQKLVAWFDYSNMGQTPARDVELKVSAKIYDNFPVFTPPWEEPGTREDIGKGGILLPSVTWQKYCVVHDPVTKKELIFTSGIRGSLEIHKRRVWVWGTMRYRDIFDEWAFVKFRFWSGWDIRHDSTRHRLKYFPLIADIEHTTAEYGKKDKPHQ